MIDITPSVKVVRCPKIGFYFFFYFLMVHTICESINRPGDLLTFKYVHGLPVCWAFIMRIVGYFPFSS